MKKLFLLLLTAVLSATALQAQSYATFPIEVNKGLTDGYMFSQYYWDSPTYIFDKPVQGVRITFLETNSTASFNGFPVVALSDLQFYDGSNFIINYTSDKVRTNSLEASEGSIAGICDGSLISYYHSAWNMASIFPDDPVYVEVKFPNPVNAFSITYYTRDSNIAPTSIALTEYGVKYDPNNAGGNGGSSGGESGGGNGSTDNGNQDTDNSFTYDFEDFKEGEAYYVYLSNGEVEAYPVEQVDGEPYYSDDNSTLFLDVKGGEVVSYDAAEIDSCSMTMPEFPHLTSFKFNNKYNHNLFVDAIAEEITPTINFSLNSIGKWLTPSFDVSDPDAVVYVDSMVQTSKVSRVDFADGKRYVVTYPGYTALRSVKVQDEIWEVNNGEKKEIPLTESMLYTNKPSNVGDDLGNMLDGNSSTIFHTAYGASYDASVTPYITATLNKEVDNISFYYMTRNSGRYNPSSLNLYVSKDGSNWTLKKSFTAAADGLPLAQISAEYTSPVIQLGDKYKHFKFEQTASEYHNNHMVLAEFRLYETAEADGDSTLIQEEKWEQHRVPFGRSYKIDIEWLTDKATSVPRIDIDIEDGRFVTSKDYYLNANFRITGYGVYEDFEDSVQIKGRGNSSWGWPKKPYRLKFEEKIKPFGLTKGKSWVLLSNYNTGSMMTNAIAMKVGQLAGAEYPNHTVPVELYMNGVYQGSYIFTEKVGMANNSVDIDEELGYLLELDDYFDETYKFNSEYFGLPVNVKEPDLTEFASDVRAQRFKNIQREFNRLDSVVYNNKVLSNVLDLPAAARFLLTNDLVLNNELCHPKSTFLFKEIEGDDNSKFKLGPLWDFDWAYGYEGGGGFYKSSKIESPLMKESMNTSSHTGYHFFSAILSHAEFAPHYYHAWTELMSGDAIEEICDYINDYYNYAKQSFTNNASIWGDGYNYASNAESAKTWIRNRSQYLYSNLEEYDIEDLLHTVVGDINCNDYVTIRDVVYTIHSYNKKFIFGRDNTRADIDGNGKNELADVEAVASFVLSGERLPAIYMYNTPYAAAYLDARDVELSLERPTTLPVNVVAEGEDVYKAMQMDITVPAGLNIDVVKGDRTAEHTVVLNQTGENTYRLAVYSTSDALFADGNEVVNFTISANELPAEDTRSIKFDNILVVDNTLGNVNPQKEEKLAAVNVGLEIGTGIVGNTVAQTVKGGDLLTITLLTPQDVNIYSVDGRLVRTIRATEGTTVVDLPAGIYVVLGEKVIIK